MPRILEADRQRAKRPKVRTGCKTCKVRRVKCDETKPFCLRCTSTGRRCDGYDLTNGENQQRDLMRSPFNSFNSDEEWKAFQQFQNRTTSQLQWFRDSKLWNCIVLQAAHADPAVRHAVFALAAVHKDFEQVGTPNQKTAGFAARQYRLAIQKHLTRLNTVKRDNDHAESYVTSCLLFICIEMLRCHFESATSLIRQVIALLSGFRNTGYRPLMFAQEDVWDLLCRLQAQMIGLIGPCAFYPPVFSVTDTAGFPDLPEHFTSIAEAKRYSQWFQFWQNLTQGAVGMSISPETISAHRQYINRWSSAFASLQITLRGHHLDERDSRALDTLKVYQRFLRLSLEIATKQRTVANDPNTWDPYHHEFRQVIGLAQSVIQQSDLEISNRATGETRLLTMDFSLLAALFDTAQNSQDPTIRKRAIEFLRISRCREGLFDGLLAAQFAERSVEQEENAMESSFGTASDLPAFARIFVTTPCPTSAARGVALNHAILDSP